MKRKHLIVTESDKGDTTVLLRKEEYVRRTEEFIQRGPYKEAKYDQRNKYHLQINKLLKEIIIFTYKQSLSEKNYRI